ncbi:MAG: L,D-transpeptidase [Chlamydiales bacterium]|nr:L,D-transpeptidase [Chlamydiales bacterium]
MFADTIPVDLCAALKRLHHIPTKDILVIRVHDQALSHYRQGKLVKSYKVSTGKNGVGEAMGSNKTPLGLHSIASKFGKDAPPYTIFIVRKNTREVWNPHKKYDKDDLVLTRIFYLEGLEKGVNQGKNKQGVSVDSYLRNIYIHGTNHEEDLGVPKSNGCVRMATNDIIALFDEVDEGSLVWICKE